MPDSRSDGSFLFSFSEDNSSTTNEERLRLNQHTTLSQSYGSNDSSATREAQPPSAASGGNTATTTNHITNTPISQPTAVASGESGHEEPSAAAAEESPPPYEEAVDDVVTSLARRVRCLFSVITWPIVPLGTTASLALVWLIYASAVLDVGKTCSHPLHWYAIMSLVLVLYAPYHGRIRSFLFNYRRERGSERPPSVRRYDQLFHTLALIYVYAGITLVQTCRDDVYVLNPEASNDNNNNSGGTGGASLSTSSSSSLSPLGVALDWSASSSTSSSSSSSTLTPQGVTLNLSASSLTPPNTCAATCPNLFLALRVYVATVEVFTFSLILPLLFLPCLYLYFIRRTMQDAESLAVLQDRFREEELLIRNGGVTEQEIMDQFEKVRLVVDPSSTEERRVVVVPGDRPAGVGAGSGTPMSLQDFDECRSKECCICMESFSIQEDEEAVAGSFGEDDDDNQIIIRTRTCGHLFHRRCIASWVGGRWQVSTTTTRSISANNNGSTSHNVNQPAEGGTSNHRQESSSRRARRTTCPLCRRDVRPNR